MKQFLSFDRSVTPLVVQFLFWVALVFTIFLGIYDIVHHKYWLGLQFLILGPLCARVLAELILVFFRIAQKLEIICTLLKNKPYGD